VEVLRLLLRAALPGMPQSLMFCEVIACFLQLNKPFDVLLFTMEQN
jgi:hypothetical protein